MSHSFLIFANLPLISLSTKRASTPVRAILGHRMLLYIHLLKAGILQNSARDVYRGNYGVLKYFFFTPKTHFCLSPHLSLHLARISG
jgi:hypothetical protein